MIFMMGVTCFKCLFHVNKKIKIWTDSCQALYNKLLAKTGGHYVIRINQVYPDEKVNLEEGEPFYDTFWNKIP